MIEKKSNNEKEKEREKEREIVTLKLVTRGLGKSMTREQKKKIKLEKGDLHV